MGLSNFYIGDFIPRFRVFWDYEGFPGYPKSPEFISLPGNWEFSSPGFFTNGDS